MDPLLARQIRRHLSKDAKNDPSVKIFLDAVQRSYQNYEDQLGMLQRAMSISSEELFDANQQLRKEAEQQRKVISSLNGVIQTLESIIYKKGSENSGKTKELSGIELASHIEKQAIKISEIENQRETILKNLEKSNKELKDYAHIVSHDLKSPLRNISTLIHWIKEDSKHIDDGTLKNLNLIDKNIEKMDHLISGILKYSSIDQVEHIERNIVLQDVITDILDVIHIPDHFEVEVVTKLPVVKGDKVRLQQLFQNVLNNAIKYNDKEKGMVTISCAQNDDYWEFAIADNGPGIPEKYHHKIFQIFQTLDDKNESTGVGLSIVKKIVELSEGEIWLDSKEGVGTTFHFTLKKKK